MGREVKGKNEENLLSRYITCSQAIEEAQMHRDPDVCESKATERANDHLFEILFLIGSC